MTTPNHGEQTRADLENDVYGPELQRQVDLDLIAHLEAVGRLDQEKIANLETALASARFIGAAIGILMERLKVTSDEAFKVLVATSHRTRLKLRDVAERLVRTGELPDSGPAR